MTIEKEKNSLRNRMATMAVGDRFVVGTSYKPSTIRNYATLLGIELQRQFSTHYNRSNNTHEVTRIA